jgi:hypothetical protein
MWYRISQFWRQITAGSLPPSAWQEISACLSPAELALFHRFDAGDQWHGYRVWQMLRGAGHMNRDLAVAALLHDVGKTRARFTAVDRSIESLLRRLFPRKAQVWEQGDVGSWRRPFVVRAHHAEWSAAMAERAGSSPTAVSLIRRHQDPLPEILTSEDELLRQLQWADNQN